MDEEENLWYLAFLHTRGAALLQRLSNALEVPIDVGESVPFNLYSASTIHAKKRIVALQRLNFFNNIVIFKIKLQ